VVRHPIEIEVADVADDLAAAVGKNGFDLHRLAAQVEVRLEVRDQRVLLQDGEPFGVGDRVGRNVEQRAISQSGESNQITPLLRLLALRIEPDSDFNRVGNLLADGVQMLVPRNLFTWQQQFARALPELVVTLSDSPL